MNRMSIFLLFTIFTGTAEAWEEPKGRAPTKAVVVTVDACSSKFDEELIQGLIKEKIKATVFVSGNLINGNKKAYEMILNNPEIFQVASHGFKHKAAVWREKAPYGLPAAQSQESYLEEEVLANERLLEGAENRAKVFRGAGAIYSQGMSRALKEKGLSVGIYSSAPDMGGSARPESVKERLAQSSAGEIILIHATRPGSGLAKADIEGLIAIRNKGFSFAWWTEGFMEKK